MRYMRVLAVLVLGVLVPCSLTGCLVIGHSTGGGWFVWPGGFGLLVLVVIAALVLRRR